MPDPQELGPIYWSSAAQNFYQQGRSGVVPRLEALDSLAVRDTATGPRLVDQTGHFVPNIPDLIPDQFQQALFNAQRTYTFASQDATEVPPGANSYYSTLFTYTDPEGKIHVGIIANRVGDTIDSEVLLAKMTAQVGADLGIDRNDVEGGSDNIQDMIGGQAFNFVVQ